MAEPVIKVRTILSVIASLLSFYDLAGLAILTLIGLDFTGYAIVLVFMEVLIWYFVYLSFDPFNKEYY